MTNPTIVVLAYNRPSSLARLLNSILKATYDESDSIRLCISIDYQNSIENNRVLELAEELEWPFGPKEVIRQEENLGLKEHVLLCGDLTSRYESIIMLEDDLIVCPLFYKYSKEALDFYANCSEIAGLSLYSHRVNISNLLEFEPIFDGLDVYFLKIASSWGQAWSKQQWKGFKEWLSFNPKVNEEANLPNYIKGWPQSSWLKHFIHYLTDTGKWFVYPRVSYTTNFSDKGTHNDKNSTIFQVPLNYSTSVDFQFTLLSDSNNLYDAYFECCCLEQFDERLLKYEFESDMYGLKELDRIEAKYLLTSRDVDNPVFSYGMILRPMIANLIHRSPGNDFSLALLSDVRGGGVTDEIAKKDKFEFFYRGMSFKTKLYNVFYLLLNKVAEKIGLR